MILIGRLIEPLPPMPADRQGGGFGSARQQIPHDQHQGDVAKAGEGLGLRGDGYFRPGGPIADANHGLGRPCGAGRRLTPAEFDAAAAARAESPAS